MDLRLACILALYFCSSPTASGEQVTTRYERSATYDSRTAGRVFRDSVALQFLGPDEAFAWYRVRTGPESHEFVLVDTTEGTRQTFSDHAALMTRLREVAGERALAENGLAGVEPMAELRPSRNGGEATEIEIRNEIDQTLEVFWHDAEGDNRAYGRMDPGGSFSSSTYAGHVWLMMDQDGNHVAAFRATTAVQTATIDADTPVPRPLQETRQRRNRNGEKDRRQSPDGRWSVFFRDHNVVLVDNESGDEVDATDAGTPGDDFAGAVWWSPDSQRFVVLRTRHAPRRQVAMIDSAPEDQLHAKTVTIGYAKPGDELDHPRPYLFHVDGFFPQPDDSGSETTNSPSTSNPPVVCIDDSDFSNPYEINRFAWRADSTAFSFVYNQRGHQTLRVISVDAESGTPRVVIDETSSTFVCYSHKSFLERLDETDEMIWMTERDGWNHLILVDASTGEVKNAITSGHWVVRRVERVDAEKRQIWLRVGGINPGEDPYHVHLVRVDFDGSNLTRLTEGDGTHTWEYSPQGRFLIDRYSRVDLPPVTNLRDAETGDLVCELERADWAPLLATGWSPPERFVAKGRDGETDIYGIIVRPTDFDSSKKYPLLEAIYAGPHASFTPKAFGRHSGLYEMAELGFIVIKLDGMGTSDRSKAFHDVCWQNLGDSGFPDRIAWIKAAAENRPEMDLQRVGIWGGSAGGQSALRALLVHSDFYHAAAADCGCHDNRMDKIWWNEQWMGYPVGPHYEQQSNVTQAHRLEGKLLLTVGELDKNVDPASTMQVVDALIKADKDFELIVFPGRGHGAGASPYGKRRMKDFFLRALAEDACPADAE